MYGKLHIKHPTAIIIRPETFRTRSDGSIYKLIKRPIAIPNSIPAFALSFISTPQTSILLFNQLASTYNLYLPQCKQRNRYPVISPSLYKASFTRSTGYEGCCKAYSLRTSSLIPKSSNSFIPTVPR